MADRHKRRPLVFRPPEADETWLADYAAETGRAVNAILTDALRGYRGSLPGPDVVSPPEPDEAPDGDTTSPAVLLAENQHLSSEVARLEAELDDALRSGRSCCPRCQTELACPRCYREENW